MQLRTLDDAERYLNGLINREKRDFDYEALGLDRVRALLASIGDPQKGLPCVHVAGSNGKGSVALATGELLRAAGLRVGVFTSPHLESWRERFLIDGQPIDADPLLEVLRRIQPAIEGQRLDPALCPSFFDVATALALAVFREHRVEAAVIEVGIGGRLDSTNVVEPRVSVITAIQFEHTDKLGDTLELIAAEKAGIIKPKVPVLHGPLDPEAWGAIAAKSVAMDAPLEEVEARDVCLSATGLSFRLDDGRELTSPVLGAHQATNLALGVRAAETFLGRELSGAELGALESLRLPARLERIGRVLLDSAHTPEAALALARTLDAIDAPERVLVVSISRDKDAAGILVALAGRAGACVLTRGEASRSIDPDELLPLAWAAGIEEVEAVEDPIAALDRALELAGDTRLVVAAGSVYFAGAVRGHLLRTELGENPLGTDSQEDR